MINQSQYKFKRRYYRVPFSSYEEPVFDFLGAHVRLASGDQLRVIDLSYNGISFTAEDHFENLDVGMLYQLELLLAGYPVLPLKIRLVRKIDGRIAGEFVDLDCTVRLSIFDFLNIRLTALQVRKVNPQFVKSEGERKVWYQGPQETEINLSLDKSLTLQKSELKLENRILFFEDNQLWQEDFERPGVRKAIDRDFFAQALGLLLHIPKKDFALNQMISLLKAHGSISNQQAS